MGYETHIEWCHHTWNPWRGCVKVSPGCAHCYAERDSHRNPKVLGEWGPGSYRVIAAPSYWQAPFRWERSALAAGERRRVFSLSLGDWLEDHPGLNGPRLLLLDTVRRTPGLDWLLLTKRPENWDRLLRHAIARIPGSCCEYDDTIAWVTDWLLGKPPANVWLGTSVEDRKHGFPRIDTLREIPAAIRFMSVEPLLEDLGPLDLAGIDWVIVGGESGPHARPCDLSWVRSIVAQCRAAGAAVFVKQLGARPFDSDRRISLTGPDSHAITIDLGDKKGGDWSEWPQDLRVREFPAARSAVTHA